MGGESSKFTQSIKSQILTQQLKYKIISDVHQSDELEAEFTISKGVLSFQDESYNLELPDGHADLITYEHLSSEITIHFRGQKKIVLMFDNLNTFLQWRRFISVSMRPLFNKNQKECQVCSKRFGLFDKTLNCHACGKQTCEDCTKYVVVLEFLGYNNEERICGSCIRLVNRVRAEETTSMLQRANSKSFVRKSTYSNSSIYKSIRLERGGSILRTGCPAALNTV